MVYTGTRDNDTTAGWFTARPGRGGKGLKAERNSVLRTLGTDGSEIHGDFIQMAVALYLEAGDSGKKRRFKNMTPHKLLLAVFGTRRRETISPERFAHREVST